MTVYVLSEDADQDLQDIYLYSVGVWGDVRAEKYINEIYDRFNLIASQPEIGRARPDIFEGARVFPSGSHLIFYLVRPTDVAIVRVLHGSRDVVAVLGDFDSGHSPR